MKRLALWCAMTAVSCVAWADDDTALGQSSPNKTVSGSLNLVTENNQTTVADNSNSLPSKNNTTTPAVSAVGWEAHPTAVTESDKTLAKTNNATTTAVRNNQTAVLADNQHLSGSLKNNQSNNAQRAENTTHTHFNHSNSSQADSEKISGSLKDNQADNEAVYPYKSSGSLNIVNNQNTATGANNETVSGSLKGNQANNQPRTRRVPKDNYQLNLSVSGDESDLTTNNKLADLLKEHLSLYNRQKTPNMDADQIAFLVQETASEVAQIVATEGFFNSQTEVVENGNQYTIKVNLGKRTRVDNVILVLDGAVLEDNELPLFYRQLLGEWALPMGEPFRQEDWADSKSAALSGVQRRKYPLAKITESSAKINKENNTAELTVIIDSKPIVYFGDISIDGIKRYPESIPRNLAPFSRGAVYDFDKLADYQEYLEQDGHYGTVAAYADLDNVSEDYFVPVKVNLVEVPRQKVDVGLQYDTLDGVGTRLGYTHYNMFKRGYTGSAVLSANRYEQSLGLGIAQPRDDKGHFYTSSINFKNKELQGVETKTLATGLWKARVRNNIDSRMGVEYYLEDARIKGGEKLGTSYATMLTASWKSNRIRTKERPANGWYFSGKVGSTLGTALSTANVQRITADAAYYFTPEQKKYGTFIAKGGVGYVHTDNQAKVPSELLFRIGGMDTVRGYENESIGIPGENGSVLGGTAMANWGLEYQYPIYKNFALALFHDAGDVKNKFQDMKFKHATGTGVRWFSPFAPLSFDIAYAHDTQKIAWYVMLGTRF
ncbi:MAG: BamA/TamA family outer membrane protein [Neisseriaceae bacterium]|nr:BamA/TamA family outer membrane protein [Neisseriaceae bacterium]